MSSTSPCRHRRHRSTDLVDVGKGDVDPPKRGRGRKRLEDMDKRGLNEVWKFKEVLGKMEFVDMDVINENPEEDEAN